ncbi:heme acquisition protein HasA [Pseudomonas sp. GD04091]|uniref:heme acquisition protein HasA n=2 Tax=unclassified Pseudomonas TaxID=196821 RepID=UPI0024496616|nr:heme acquisition protein HasA [Pseudomonas sp. GD04091]MDH0303104.1 heme acquisition protein HasA [Pseudomonas sp. GD04091]
MSLTISFESYFAPATLDDYLAFWRQGFDPQGNGGISIPAYVSGAGAGTTWFAHGNPGSEYGVVLHGEGQGTLFSFSTPEAFLAYGQLDSVTLGATVTGGGGSPLTFMDYGVRFAGLDLGAAAQSAVADNQVHQVAEGLLRGDTSALEVVLDRLLADYGVSTDDTFEAVGLALAAGPHAAATAQAVGVPVALEEVALAA